jgi:hypothetical protein
MMQGVCMYVYVSLCLCGYVCACTLCDGLWMKTVRGRNPDSGVSHVCVGVVVQSETLSPAKGVSD